MEWYWFFFAIVFLCIAIVVALYKAAKTNTFDGLSRLPQFFDEKVYSFFYVEENYPDFNVYGLSPDSKIYTVTNPKDNVETSFFHFPSTLTMNSNNNTSNNSPEKKPVLIFFRGNGIVKYRLDAIVGIQKRCDIDVVMVCYRGSFEGLSHDQPCRYRINSDNEIAWKEICKQFDFDEYYIYGLSIGSAIATQFVQNRIKEQIQTQKQSRENPYYYSTTEKQTNRHRQLKGVILDNVFTALDSSFVWSAQNSGIDAVNYVPEWALSAFCQGLLAFCGEVYPNLEIWKETAKAHPSLRLLVFSSGNDRVMPPQDGDLVANTMKNNRFVLVEGADHGSNSDQIVFYDEIQKFIN